MAAVVKGTAHVYGVSGTVTNATVLAFSRKKMTANNGQTENEDGNVIERRYDDITTEATITIRAKSAYTEPAIGDTLTYDSVKYTVESVDEKQQNKGFNEYTLSLKTSEGITLA
mgnify:CR=1 FL=1